MPLQLDLTKDQLWYCKLLAKGQVEFNELDFETQLIVYESNVDISDTVSEEDLREFEDKLALKNYFGPREMAKAAARRTKERLV
jgi:hypothetical protein